MAHNNFTGGSCKICRWEHLLVLQVPGAESQPALALLVPHSPLKKITAFKSCIYECKMLLNSNSFVSCHSHTVHSAPLKCARAGGALRCATTTSSSSKTVSPPPKEVRSLSSVTAISLPSLSLWLGLFWTFPVHGITYAVACCIWLLSLSSRSIRVVSSVGALLLFTAGCG